MKKRKVINLRSILSLIALILVMLFIQIPAQGATCSTVISGTTYPDTDCDGLLDAEETQPIPQCSSTSEYQTTWSSCNANGSGCSQTHTACNSTAMDLFAILLPCGDTNNPSLCQVASKLPTTPLGIFSTAARNVLGITVHQITPSYTCCSTNTTVYPACCNTADTSNCTAITSASCTKNVTPTQMAVRILESTDTTAPNLGYTLTGTVATAGDATVWTQKIINAVEAICKCGPTSNCTTCVDVDGITIGEQNVIQKFIRHTIAHEAGHAMTLRAVSTTDIGEHYPSGTNTLLDSSVKVQQSTRSKVTTSTWYIGSNYYTGTAVTPNDVGAAKLR